jgi:sugar/nucleoside kinase (ribokinase family)
LASFSYKYLLTENVDKSIDFANQCATQVVQKRGVSTI